MTTRPLDDAPPGVKPRSGEIAAVVAELEGRGCGRVWIEGGGTIVWSMIAIGIVDVLELALIPRILGEGVPLFPTGTPDLKLQLGKCQAESNGAVHLVYRRASDRARG